MIKTFGTDKVKVLDYQTLERLNRKAVKERVNRSLDFDRLPISEGDLFPVAMAFAHNDGHRLGRANGGMRTQIVLNEEGATAWLDMSVKEYNPLPEHTPTHAIEGGE